MKHLLLTRVDVPLTKAVYDPAWLERRRVLFETYCLPSVAAQISTATPFEWLVYVRPESPMLDLEPMYQKRVPTLRMIEVHSNEDAKAHARLAAGGETRLLLTTRLDADDAIGERFMWMVQRAAKSFGSRKAVINFPDGVVLDHASGAIYLDIQRSNPFTTLVERNPVNALTVWGAKHHDLRQLAPVYQIESKGPMWCQVIHGDNLANGISGDRMPVGWDPGPGLPESVRVRRHEPD